MSKYNNGKYRMSVAGDKELQNKPISITEDGVEYFSSVDAALDRKANASSVSAKCDLSVIAPTYSSKATYSEGDLVIHSGKLYAAKSDIETAEAWTAAHWDETSVAALISAL
jgi:hypothetical protein